MLDDDALGDGWTVWNAEDDRVILAYRPDVFDGTEFPSPCLPAIYVTRGSPTRRPGANRNPPPDAPWTVTLFLEPEIERDPDSYDSLGDALTAAEELTHRFADGEIDYRALYQVPREDYFAKLDELTGRTD